MTVPEILKLPPKMLPMISEFNNYVYFLGEGGRGSSKTQSVGRFLLFLGEKYKLNICCGREIQNTINESVKAVFEGLINEFNLNYTIKDKEIIHNETGTRIIFKGFREQGKVNIKGLADIDILWIDEAEAITKPTLDIIIPTIMRKKNARIFFTMNRFVRNDAVYVFCNGRPDCLHIHINYFDNPYLTEQMIKEAEICKANNESDYNHIWLGQPKDQQKDFLISVAKIDTAKSLTFTPEKIKHNTVMSVDLAGSGGDLNVLKLLRQVTSTVWEEVLTMKWHEADTDVTVGKILYMNSLHNPDILIIDADGVGYPIVNTIKKSIPNCVAFRGAGAVKSKTSTAKNARAEGYFVLKEFFQNEWIKLKCEQTARQLEYIKVLFKPQYTVIQSKEEIRKEQGESPDYADTLMMALYAIDKYSYMFHEKENSNNTTGKVQTDFNPYED